MMSVTTQSTAPSPRQSDRLDRLGRASWSATGILVLAIIAALLVPHLVLILVPVVAATIFSALLLPLVRQLERMGVRPILAVILVFVGALAVLAACALLIAPAVTTEFDAIRSSLDGGLVTIEDWLSSGPLGLSKSMVTGWGNDLRNQTGSITSSLARSAVAQTSLVLDIVAASVLTVVLTFFFVKDGPKLATKLIDRVAPKTQSQLGGVWVALTGYSQGLVVNGVVNATVLGATLAIMGIPLALPIAAITLLASFIPVAGAVVAGVMAALIALVASGPTAAAVVIAVTILIHHLEGYVIGPMVIGRRVGLHPVVLILAFLLGIIVAGIAGGFLAGPFAAAASGWFSRTDTIATATIDENVGLSASVSAQPNKGKKP